MDKNCQIPELPGSLVPVPPVITMASRISISNNTYTMVYTNVFIHIMTANIRPTCCVPNQYRPIGRILLSHITCTKSITLIIQCNANRLAITTNISNRRIYKNIHDTHNTFNSDITLTYEDIHMSILE